MTKLLHRCTQCREYTLQEVCPRCGGAARPNVPPKFSPEDRYGEYRRRLKRETWGRPPAASPAPTTSTASAVPAAPTPAPGASAPATAPASGAPRGPGAAPATPLTPASPATPSRAPPHRPPQPRSSPDRRPPRTHDRRKPRRS